MVGFNCRACKSEPHPQKTISYPRISPTHKEAIETIWKKCGRSPFLWNYVAEELHKGTGIMRTLHDSGYTEAAGRGCPTGVTRLWKLNTILANRMETEIGPVSPLVEQACAAHNALKWDQWVIMQRASEEKKRLNRKTRAKLELSEHSLQQAVQE